MVPVYLWLQLAYGASIAAVNPDQYYVAVGAGSLSVPEGVSSAAHCIATF